MNYPPSPVRRRWAAFAAFALLGLPISQASAATFTWGSVTGNWSDGANWGGIAPIGLDPTDVLQFGGDVATVYTATNNVANPFLLNQLVINASNEGALPTLVHAIAGSSLRLSGVAPQIAVNGAGGMRIDTPIQLTAPLALTGNGTGVVTLNNTVTGAYDIVKNGTSTFRFGSQVISAIEQPSDNTWVGTLTINDGTVRFNNNATSGRTALRSNPVVLAGPGAKLTVASELRVGTLLGAVGIVESQVTGTSTENEDIIVHLLKDGTFGGTLILGAGTTGDIADDDGELTFRGSGTQTLTGNLQIRKDVVIGRGATVVLAGAASLAGQARGAIVMSGGKLNLDNRQAGGGNADRLRDGNLDSTGLETIGGGTFSLIGNVAGTTENLGRLQLGSVNDSLTRSTPRSGALKGNVSHDAGKTILNFAAYTRDNRSAATNPSAGAYTTLDFSATDLAGNLLVIGPSGPTGPRITFAGFAVPLFNGLFDNTGVGAGASTNDTGWATVNGTDFATYLNTIDNGSERGVRAVFPTTFPVGTGVGDPLVNTRATGNVVLSNAAGYSLHSLKIDPTAAGGHLDVTTAGDFNNRNFILAGVNDYTIQNTGGATGGITGNSGGTTRYFHVQQATLNVNVALGNGIGATGAIVKAGGGTLSLGALNTAVTAPVTINEGTLRSSTANLPQGELRFRGGVYEIAGGGFFTRPVTFGAGSVNWAGIDSFTVGTPGIDQDRGSGGFAAFGGDASTDLGLGGPTLFNWEDKGFVNSGHALIFNSTKADSRITWTDNLSLSSTTGAVNYNAREIRVQDNPGSTTDFARISGAVFGRVQDDLLKTGAGTLELAGANTYLGATLVAEGTLLVNNTVASSFLTDVRSGATLGGKGLTGAVRIENGGTLAPGEFAGKTSVLQTGELRLAGASAKLSIEIGGLTAGGNLTTGYDQISAFGAVILDGAELTGSLLNGFTPQEGDLFFIIINDGLDPVQGTFQTISFAGQAFEIGYNGDLGSNAFFSATGNDVVLRAVPEPTVMALSVLGLGLLGWRRRQA